MRHQRIAAACALLLVALFFCLPAAAQTVTGTLSGTITDTSGAVIPGAQVTIKNKDTDLTRTVTTNTEGYFSATFLPLGTYNVITEAKGFRKVTKTDVVIELNKNTVSNLKLEVSTVGAEITITGEAPAIETTTGELKHSLDSKQIEDLPLAGRNFISLVEQVPGFQTGNFGGTDSAGQNNATNSTGSYASFNGLGTRTSTFQIDGVNNDDSSENQNRQGVNISTIKAFQVLTNTFSAEFGRGGAAVLVQTKSGTNAFHGDLYDFIQNDIFNSNGFFRNAAGRSSTTGQPLQPRQAVRRHQYGGTFGGPIWLPKKFFGPASVDGRDRLFFFTSVERTFNKTSNNFTRFIFLPTDGPRACNPGEVARPGGPYCVDPATHPNLQRDLSFMRSVLDLYKTPELSGVAPNDPIACADLIASGRPNRCLTIGSSTSLPRSDYTGKLDFKATSQDTISFRYQYSRQRDNTGRIILGDNFGVRNDRQYNLGLTETHVFSTRQVGEFRYGFGNRATLQDVADDNAIPTLRFASTLCTGTGSAPFATCGTVIGTSTNVPINRRQRDHQLVYNHTITFNRHTLKMGIDQRFQALDDISGDRARGFWTFGSNDALAAITARTGFTGWENFLRGFVTAYQKGYGNPLAENRFGETNLYVQEDLRLRQNLTINLGARYEYVQAPEEMENRFLYGFGDDKDNFEPRIGFAWSPSASSGLLHRLTGNEGDFVIRGGYGINHSRLFQSVFSQNQLSLRTQPPNGFGNVFSGLCSNEISDPSCGFVFTPGTASRTAAFIANGVQDIGGRLNTTLLIPDKKLQMPYVQQWNLTLERKFLTNFALQVSYNGNRGIGLPFFDSINDAVYPIVSPSLRVDIGGGNFQPVVFDRACTDFSNPLCVVNNADGTINTAASGSLRTFSALNSTTATLAQKGIVIENGVPHGYISINTARLNERRPDALNSRNVNLQNFGWSYYHGMVVKLSKRFSSGLTFTTSYIFSKSIDTGSEATFSGVDANAPAGKKGGAAASLRGLSAFHASHRFVASYSYLLPFFSTQQGVVGRVLGGWNISGATTFQTGMPFTVTAGYDVNGDGLTGDRPRLSDLSYLGASVDNGRQISGATPGNTISQTQLPGSIFIPVQAGTITALDRVYLPGTSNEGTIGRNTFFTQGLNYTDLSAFKEIKVHEGMKIVLRMEFYNVFNRVTFGVPSARTILSATPLSRITNERNSASYVNSGRGESNGGRQGQLAIRFVF